MHVPPVQDTITFTLVAEETVVNNTVKLNATIASIVTPNMTEAKLKEGIRDMMKKIVSETLVEDGSKTPVVWTFSNMTRSNHASGMEQITLNASTRVHESDNYSLDKRRVEASQDQEGMSITSLTSDSTPPSHMIETTESNLRLKLLTKAYIELEKINTLFEDNFESINNYRVGDLVFVNVNDPFSASNNSARIATNTMKTTMSGSYGSGFDYNDTLGNAIKLTMQVNVTLSKSFG